MEREPTVVVIGAGYVGLTLGLFIASRRIHVLIVDIDASKVERLQRGNCTIYEADIQKALSNALESGYLSFGSEPPALGARYWIVAAPYIPSELTEDGVHRYLKCLESIRGAGASPPVVMIRSTLPVGFTRSKIVPRLHELLGAPLDEGFFVSVCPERTLTGSAIEELESIPQLVGGSQASLEKTDPFFKSCGISCVALETYEAAEIGKTFCNLSRLVQFNLANFFGLCCETFGVNAQELRRALTTHYPRLQLSMPGPGVGGSCLPKDSLVLFDGLTRALQGGSPETAAASQVWAYPKQQYLLNEQVIAHVAQAVEDFTHADTSRPVLACGIAFKGMPRTDDTRNSVGLKIVETLLRNQVDVRVLDLGVQASSVRGLGLKPASVPVDPAAYSNILLLNNDPGYLELLRSGLSSGSTETVGLYDPWRLILSDGPTVFAKAVPLTWFYDQLQVRPDSGGSNATTQTREAEREGATLGQR